MSEPIEPKKYPPFASYRGAFKVLVDAEMDRLEREYQAWVRENEAQAKE